MKWAKICPLNGVVFVLEGVYSKKMSYNDDGAICKYWVCGYLVIEGVLAFKHVVPQNVAHLIVPPYYLFRFVSFPSDL